MNKKSSLRIPPWSTDVGLLFLRLSVFSMMLFGHGLTKLTTFSERAATFSDPLGVGSETSLVLAILGELVGSALVIVGLATRAGALLVLFAMLVAAMVVHADDPWAKKELALLYAMPALTLILTGAGRFSIDGWIVQRKKRD